MASRCGGRDVCDCRICFDPYDLRDKLPMVLPCCGCCLCKVCSNQLKTCPHCYKLVDGAIPNFTLREMLESLRRNGAAVGQAQGGDGGGSTVLCPKHRGQTLSFFCKQDMISCCALCLLSDHRDHGYDELSPSNLQKELLPRLDMLMEMAGAVLASNANTKELLKEINEHRSTLTAIFSRLEDLQARLVPALTERSDLEAALEKVQRRRDSAPQTIDEAAQALTEYQKLKILIEQRLMQWQQSGGNVDLRQFHMELEGYRRLSQVIQGLGLIGRPEGRMVVAPHSSSNSMVVHNGYGSSELSSSSSPRPRQQPSRPPLPQEPENPSSSSSTAPSWPALPDGDSAAGARAGGGGNGNWVESTNGLMGAAPRLVGHNPGLMGPPAQTRPPSPRAIPRAPPAPIRAPSPPSQSLSPSISSSTTTPADSPTSSAASSVTATTASATTDGSEAEIDVRNRWQKGTVSCMLHELDGFVMVPQDKSSACVYFNLLGGRVTTVNATGFDPEELKVGREVLVQLGHNPDKQITAKDKTKRFVARSMKLGDPLPAFEVARGVISGLFNDNTSGFIKVMAKDGRTEFKVYFNLANSARLQTIGQDSTITPSKLRLGMPVLVQLMKNPAVEQHGDISTKYVARALKVAA